MASETGGCFGYSYSQSVWDGKIRDVVSVFIYNKDKQSEIQVLVCENHGVLCLPVKEITADDTRQEPSYQGVWANFEENAPDFEDTPTTSQGPLWVSSY